MMIRKLFKAELAHATWGAYTKRCHHVHGHSYRFELFLTSQQPNSSHMVMDFKAIKDVGIYDFLDSFDHAIMLWEKDPRAKTIQQINPERHILVPFIPTAEMMAKAFFSVCQAILETGPKLSGEAQVKVSQFIVHETDTGFAVYREEDLKVDVFPDIQFEKWIFSDGIKAAWSNKGWFERARERLTVSAPTL